MSVVVKAENISKVFKLGDVGSATLTEDLRSFMHKLRGKDNPYHLSASENDRQQTGGSDYVWAVKDVNFEVKQGEILGIIGRNGAGKSTLLKILSRTTSPTTGKISIKGKIASLLEVGTGFHPDLSGRENIFLNGAILGMRKQEIRSKFDDIVQFAGVERYIDTPVKRYSSGMYVRLAFAVAAHLDPDILIIDEVLAVGDSEFQSKCLGKMKDVSEQGRTVLFVSHNMGAVSDLCSRALMLRNGTLHLDGATEDVIREYIQINMKAPLGDHGQITDAATRRGNGRVRYTSIKMLNSKGGEDNEFYPGEEITFRFKARVEQKVEQLLAKIAFRSGKTRDIITTTQNVDLNADRVKEGDEVSFSITFHSVNLRAGVYETYFWLGDDSAETAYDVVDNLVAPLVIKTRPDESPFVVGYFDLRYTSNIEE